MFNPYLEPKWSLALVLITIRICFSYLLLIEFWDRVCYGNLLEIISLYCILFMVLNKVFDVVCDHYLLIES